MSDMTPEDALFASAGLLVAIDEKIAEQQKRIKELEAKVAKYEKWFQQNAGYLASHNVGGYRWADEELSP